jgi:lysine/ornithine N-monooxygenase
MKIWKYELRVGESKIRLPREAKVLSVIAQNSKIVLYALIDEKKDERLAVTCDFKILTTGYSDASFAEGMAFLGTVDKYKDGSLILHVFVDKIFKEG